MMDFLIALIIVCLLYFVYWVLRWIKKWVQMRRLVNKINENWKKKYGVDYDGKDIK
jgi:hypothetical protein